MKVGKWFGKAKMGLFAGIFAVTLLVVQSLGALAQEAPLESSSAPANMSTVRSLIDDAEIDTSIIPESIVVQSNETNESEEGISGEEAASENESGEAQLPDGNGDQAEPSSIPQTETTQAEALKPEEEPPLPAMQAAGVDLLSAWAGENNANFKNITFDVQGSTGYLSPVVAGGDALTVTFETNTDMRLAGYKVQNGEYNGTPNSPNGKTHSFTYTITGNEGAGEKLLEALAVSVTMETSNGEDGWDSTSYPLFTQTGKDAPLILYNDDTANEEYSLSLDGAADNADTWYLYENKDNTLTLLTQHPLEGARTLHLQYTNTSNSNRTHSLNFPSPELDYDADAGEYFFISDINVTFPNNQKPRDNTQISYQLQRDGQAKTLVQQPVMQWFTTKLEISSVTNSNGSRGDNWVLDGTQVQFEIYFNLDVAPGSISFAGVTARQSSQAPSAGQVTYTLDNSGSKSSGKRLVVKALLPFDGLAYNDELGLTFTGTSNGQVITHKGEERLETYRYLPKLEIVGFSIDAVRGANLTGDGHAILREGDALTVEMEFNRPIIGTDGEAVTSSDYPSISVGGVSGIELVPAFVAGRYIYASEGERYLLGTLTDNTWLRVAFTQRDYPYNTNRAFNHSRPPEDEAIACQWARFYRPLSVDAAFKSKATDNEEKARQGNIVTLTLTPNHEADLLSATMAGLEAMRGSEEDVENAGRPVAYQQEDDIAWYIGYKLPENTAGTSLRHNMPIEYEFLLQDKAHIDGDDPTVHQFTEGGLREKPSVDFLEPLTLSDIKLTVQEERSLSENGKYYLVRDDDVLTVSFLANQEIKTESGLEGTTVYIGGQPAEFNAEPEVVTDDETGALLGYRYSAALALPREGITDQQELLVILVVNPALVGEPVVYNDIGQEAWDSPRAKYYAPIEVESFTVWSSNSVDPNEYLVDSNSVTIQFETNHFVTLEDIVIAGIPVDGYDIRETEGDTDGYTVEIHLAELDERHTLIDNEKLTLSYGISDAAGNTQQVGTHSSNTIQVDGTLVYYAPIILSDALLQTDNSTNGARYAIDGNTVELTFTANHELIFELAQIAGLPAEMEISGDNNYRLWYTLENGDLPDQTVIGFALAISDAAGNTLEASEETLPARNTPVYFAPITPENILFSYRANDGTLVGPSSGEALPVKDGQTIVVEVNFNHAVELLLPARVAGLSAQRSDELRLDRVRPANGEVYYLPAVDEGETWTRRAETWYLVARLPAKSSDPENVYFQTNLTDDALVELLLSAADVAGNDTYTLENITQAVEDTTIQVRPLRYYAPLAVLSLDTHVNVEEPLFDEQGYYAAKTGQEIVIVFETGHPVVMPEINVTLAGKVALAASFFERLETDGYFYQAVLELDNETIALLEDLDILAPEIEIKDVLDQTVRLTRYNAPEYVAVRFYEPIAISGITVSSTNRSDGLLYAKDEDTLRVSFTANHMVYLSDTRIAGFDVTVTNDYRGGRQLKYEFGYTLQNGDLPDLSTITFAFAVADAAANDPQSFSNSSDGVHNEIVYYTPLVATSSLTTSNSNPGFAKNGDTITISATTNHEAAPFEASWGSRSIGSSETFVEQPVVSYTIPVNESEMYETEIFYSLTLEDPAGNYVLVNNLEEDGSGSVVYDRTPPSIEILPAYSGFTNEEQEFTLRYSDLYLDLSSISCVVNTREQVPVQQGSDTTFSYNVIIDEDGEYRLSVSARDLAGNEQVYEDISNLILDTVLPVIERISEQSVFPVGYKLSDDIEIEELYLQEIVCTLSDMSNVYDWDIETPIEEEGKKTINIIARDMAGNSSLPFAFDIFIDGTPPRPMVEEVNSRLVLEPDTANEIVGSQAELSISLAELHLGEEADHFLRLELRDEEGNMTDLLSDNMDASGIYSHKLTVHGNYTLTVEAEDEVENSTGVLVYSFEFRDQYILESIFEGTPIEGLVQNINNTAFFISLSIAVLLLAGLIVWLLLRRKRKATPKAAVEAAPSEELINTVKDSSK